MIKSFFSTLGSYFFQGLLAVVPAAVTIYVLYWLATTAEATLGPAIQTIVTKEAYTPGMGIVAGFVLMVVIGFLLKAWIVRKVFALGEYLLENIPLVKSVYGSVRDLISFFDTSKKKSFSKVVIVKFDQDKAGLLGLVTREDFSDVPEGIGDDETVAVFLPMSYQMGGFTVMVHKSQTEPVDMRVEEAMRYALTAGMSTSKKDIKESIK